MFRQVENSIRESLADISTDAIYTYQEKVLNLTLKIYLVSFLMAIIFLGVKAGLFVGTGT